MVATTQRAQMRAGCKAVLDAVKAAHPTLLVHTYAYKPPTFRTPLGYVASGIDEPTIAHDAQTRRVEIIAEVHLTSKLVSNEQTANEQDVLVDLVRDEFTNTPRAASTASVIEPVNVSNHEEEDGEAFYPCSVISIRGNFPVGVR